jgi:hypothetical protein
VERVSPTEQSLALLQRQRHSFLNHLQVISGWLQLGNTERARTYLHRLAERLADDGQTLRSLAPEYGLLIADLNLEAETHGVLVEWQVCGSAQEHPDPAPLRAKVVEALEAASRQPELRRQLRICIGPGGFTIHTAPEAGEG